MCIRDSGYTVGGGYAVEWRGFAYGCVKTKIKGRGWTHWYKLPFIDYNDGASSVPEKEIALGSRLLKKGTEGSDVKALQEALMKLGYESVSYTHLDVYKRQGRSNHGQRDRRCDHSGKQHCCGSHYRGKDCSRSH